MSTTIYVPMSIWHALELLRNKEVVFARMIPDPKAKKRDPLEGELWLRKKLVGYTCRQGAFNVGRLTHKDEFAIVNITVYEPTHERLYDQKEMTNTERHPETGDHQWIVTAKGCAELAREAYFTMEVIPSSKSNRHDD